jgi:hypothetical protein
MRIIGCNAHYHIHKEKRARSAKFDNRARTGILVGYDGSTIYRIYDTTNGIIRSSAVVFEEDTTLTEAAVVEISDPDSETDPLGVFETPKRKASVRNGYNERRSDPQASETAIPVIHDTELEPREGGTIVVDRRPHTMQPRSIAQQENGPVGQGGHDEANDDQEAINHQLLLQEQAESNTQRGAATRRSARLLQSEDSEDRQPRLQGKGSLEANYWALDQRHWAFLSGARTTINGQRTKHLQAGYILPRK